MGREVLYRHPVPSPKAPATPSVKGRAKHRLRRQGEPVEIRCSTEEEEDEEEEEGHGVFSIRME
ncbi:hypothetical protein EK904_004404, partial [Melospiza melodia maxima]